MKNYAEELAYWYFRFNGFLLIDGHVVHRRGEPNNEGLNRHQAVAHSENDILAFRPPYVWEGVGYPHNSCPILNGFIPEGSLYTGIICDIKAGKRYRINNNNLQSQVDRVGLFENNDGIATHIREHSTYFNDGKSIIRILVKNNNRPIQGWTVITLAQIIDFIRHRLTDIRKTGGWDKFDSSLMQFLLKHP